MMTRDVILRPEAERDIAGIADYTVKQWGRRQARKYVADLRNAIQDLAINGTRHPLEDALHSGLRRTRSGRHLVFYLIDANTVDVVRVLHERMDAQLQL